MVEYLFAFLRRNQLKIKIEQTTIQSKINYSVKFIKDGKTPISFNFEYKKCPTPNQIVQDIISAYIEGDRKSSKNIQKAFVTLVGEEEFGKFLDIVSEEHISDIICPISGRDRFTVKFLTSSTSILNSCQIATFSELQYICNDLDLKDLYIESAVIKDLSFLQNNYLNLSKIKFSLCTIYSVTSLPNIDSLIFSDCKIISLSNHSPIINEATFCRCIIEMQKGENFISKAKKIELDSCKLYRLDRFFPDTIDATSVKLQSLDIKSMFKFPNSPNLELLSVINNKNLVSLFGLPSSFKNLKELVISSNPILKLIQLVSQFPQLTNLNLSSSQFESGSILNMPRLSILDVSYNNSCIFDLIQDCQFITTIKANHIKNRVYSSSLNKFELLKTISLDGSVVKFDPSTSPATFCNIIFMNGSKKHFEIVGSKIKQSIIEELSHNFFCKRIEDFEIYDSFIYCTSDLFKSVVEYYNNNSEWALRYIKEEEEPELFSQCMQFLENEKNNDRSAKIYDLLIQKYKDLYETNFSI